MLVSLVSSRYLQPGSLQNFKAFRKLYPPNSHVLPNRPGGLVYYHARLCKYGRKSNLTTMVLKEIYRKAINAVCLKAHNYIHISLNIGIKNVHIRFRYRRGTIKLIAIVQYTFLLFHIWMSLCPIDPHICVLVIGSIRSKLLIATYIT